MCATAARGGRQGRARDRARLPRQGQQAAGRMAARDSVTVEEMPRGGEALADALDLT